MLELFEFLGLFFEIICTTTIDLLYDFFVHPVKTLIAIIFEYIIAIDFDPFALFGLVVSVLIICSVLRWVAKLICKLTIDTYESLRRKSKTEKLEKSRQMQAKRVEWDAYNKEFEEIYQKYVVSDKSKK